MTTSQNVPYEAQVKNYLISQKIYVPFSRYSSFCTFQHPIIYQVCDVMMSILKETGYILNISFGPKLIKFGQLIDTNKGNNFQESFE